MAVEVKVNGEQKEVKREYPYLAIHSNGSIVLFTRADTGVVLNKVIHEIGYYTDGWGEERFTPLSPSESITLSNKA